MFPGKTEQNCCLLKSHVANGNYRPPLSGTNARCRSNWQMCCSSHIRPRYCTRTDPVASNSSSSTKDAGQWVVQAFRFVIMQIASLRHRAAVQSEFMAFRRRHFDPIFVCVCTASTVKVANYKNRRSRWPRGLTRMSVASRLLGFRGFESFRGHGKSVSCECCVVSGTSLRRADHSSRGVIPNACISECDQLQQQQPSTLTMNRYKRSNWERR